MTRIELPQPTGHKNWHQQHQATLKRSDVIADKVTAFAGTVHFLYLHFIWWAGWFVVNSSLLHITFDKYPFNLLTMILSLEAILLATLIMISQNRQAARDKVQAEHQYKHQELELLENTKLTKEINALTKLLIGSQPKRGKDGKFKRR